MNLTPDNWHWIVQSIVAFVAAAATGLATKLRADVKELEDRVAEDLRTTKTKIASDTKAAIEEINAKIAELKAK